MALRNFATCHCHPQSLDSASTPEAFAKRELELGTGVITVTDHGSLAACRTVYDLAKKYKLIPVLGLEGYFRDDNCDILTANGISKNADGKFIDYFKYAHFCVHFMDQAAYECGVRLISKAPIERHGQETKPLFNWENFEELAKHNVTITTGCLIGMVQRHLLDNNDPYMARRYFDRMLSIFGKDRLFIEVFPHVCDRNWVKGIFVELQEGDKIVKLKFHDGKKLKTNEGEITADDLAKAFLRKANKHNELCAVKDYNTWNDRTPAKILSVKKVEDFLINECRPWAPDGDVQRGCNEFVMDLAKKHKVPILIADDSHFAHPEEKPVQDVRLMASGGSWRFYGSYHRQSSEEAYAYFKNKLGVDMKTFEGWIDNSYGWAERFKNFKFVTAPSLPTKFYPQDTLNHTLELIKKHGRMDWKDKRAVTRLDEEIELLHNNGTIDLLPYFFIDEEVCWEYTKKGLLTGPGRGSAAGVRLAYLLGITHADPFDYELSLERFITKDRINSGALPDIDQDLPNRDLLVAEPDGFLHTRFGDHFAQISVDTTLKLKSAMKDVCRVLAGRVLPEVEAYTRKLPDPPQGVSDHNFVFGYTDSGNWHPGIIEFNKDLQDYIAEFPKHWDIVRKALGLARQKSRHACGFVIANRPIHEFIPTTIISDTRCTAYTPASVEAVGGVKMDFLVINSLNDISNAIKLIQQRYGTPPSEGMKLDGKWVPQCRLINHAVKLGEERFLDIWKLPEDQRVFKDISLGKTETVFQFNTPGAVQWLRQFAYRKGPDRFAIDSIEAMAAFTALDRPGPLDMEVESGEANGKKHNLLVEYARRARNAEPSPEIFTFFNTLFPETYGVMVYQEQLQKAYQYLTGCSGPEAEEFRRNIAKKKMEKVLAAYPAFKERASQKLGSEENADKAWEFFKTWGQYGFNKSHAVCYSIIAYACAYLKHHYPLEWWTAVLRNADKDEINNTFWRHAGHLIDLPDVSKSCDQFEIIGNRIQAPLSLLHGIGEKAHQQLSAGRPYKNIDDFCARIQEYKEKNATFVTKKEIKKKTNRKTKEVTLTEVEVVKKKLGRSALTRGVLYTLVVSGAMDSLFPQGMETLDLLQALEEALARATDKDVAAVNPKYINIDRFMRHQLRKKILPAYSAPLVPLIEDLALAGKMNGLVKEGNRLSYHWKEREWIPFASAQEIERIDTITPFPDDPIKVAVATYIDDVRPFSWARKDDKGNLIGTSHAVELNLDIDGARKKFVKWGNRDTGTLPTKWLHANEFKGAIGVAILSKYKEGKPFTLDDFNVIAQPLQDEPEESSKE